MEIEVFNLTDEKIDELDKLKEFLINVSNDEKLGNVIFNVIIVDNNKIKEINRDYRNIDRETDVISFALEDDKSFNTTEFRMLGDIYISIDKVRSQSKEYGHSFKRELYFLAIHGLLHLLVYDHMTKEEEEVMFSKQEEVLDRYGIKREKE
jgi:probable rRNA maturation factor